jgi:AcrR family transcriptional regulator
MTRTTGDPEPRRAQIREAAFRVFASHGYERATLREIAREAGIAHTLIYYYYPDKQAVLAAVLAEYSPLRLIESLPDIQPNQRPEDFLPSFLLRVLELLESTEFVQLTRILLPEIIEGREASLVSLITSAQAQVTQVLEAYLRAQMANGSLRAGDATRLADVLGGTIIGLAFRRGIFSGEAESDSAQDTRAALITTLCDAILHGILSDATPDSGDVRQVR